MPKKLGISRSELLQMREQGLSNRDIANLLEISLQTVFRYIGPQGKHMTSLAVFNAPEVKHEEPPRVEEKSAPRAIDTLERVYEVFKSAEGTFRAELDYESECVDILGNTIGISQLPELATFVVGLAGLVNNHNSQKEKAS